MNTRCHPPFRFRPASLTNPANQALLFSNTNEPSGWGEGIFFLSSTETAADHRRFFWRSVNSRVCNLRKMNDVESGMDLGKGKGILLFIIIIP